MTAATKKNKKKIYLIFYIDKELILIDEHELKTVCSTRLEP